METLTKKKFSAVRSNGVGKNLMTAGLAFTLSTFTLSKAMEKEESFSHKKSESEYNMLKIESDAYDMIRRML